MIQGQPGTIGRYRVRAVLGVGGVTTVYRAYDPVLDREVALKVLHPHLALDDSIRARFVREGHILARVRHPHVVQIYDADESEDMVYRVMELVDGRSLAALLAERGPLSPADTLVVTAEVAAALAAIHARGLIHRDVRPATIMAEAGSDPGASSLGRTVLLDLGGAGIFDSSTMSRSSRLIGVSGFLAPEQVAPGGRVSAQTDVYGLAATVYALLTGRPPFDGDAAQTTHAVVHSPPPDPRDHRPDLPVALAATVTRALAKDPSHRPDGALALAAQLQAALRHGTAALQGAASPAAAGWRATPAAPPRGAGADPEHLPMPERGVAGLERARPHPPAVDVAEMDTVSVPRQPVPTEAMPLAVPHATTLPPAAPRWATSGADLPRRQGAAARGRRVIPLVVTAAVLACGVAGAVLVVTQWPGRGGAPARESAPPTAAAIALVTATSPARPAAQSPSPSPVPTATPPPAPPNPTTIAPPSASPAPVPVRVAIASATARPRATPAATPEPEPARQTTAPVPVSGEWTFTDVIRYGPGQGSQYSFRVRLTQRGERVTGAGDGLAFDGLLVDGTLRATYRQGDGGGAFQWTFTADGAAFSGTFTSDGFGNGGDSYGRRVTAE